MNDNIDDFLSYIKLEKKLSQNTIYNYQLDLKNYYDYLEKVGIKNISLVTTNDIDNYLVYLNKNGLNSRSITRHITSIKEFHKYLLKTKKIKKDVSLNIQSMKQTKKLPITVNSDEMNKILDVSLDNDFKYRDKAMIELMYGSGLRVSELVNLTIYNIDFQNNVILIEGKGNKERLVPLNKYTREALIKYLEVRPNLVKKKYREEKLFLNNHGKSISRQGFNYILKNILKDKKINSKITPHSLRHTFATDLLNNGADLRSIQELLGHTDITTTRIYTHVANNKIKEDYIKYNGRNEE